ncbi:MAG: L-rhamnose mutarotase [Verrucomicrobia bacterium]|nr:L-rhamnose mutarotase [Verrucomicrobiota bacterium]
MKKIRKAFVMSVNPGQEKEYETRHRPVWPELEAVLKKHGVHNYSIFLHSETRQLFAYAERLLGSSVFSVWRRWELNRIVKI